MNDIFSNQAHRPWPLPAGPWIMAQEWCDLLFAHWPIPIETMRALVPPQLPLDTWDGHAWIGLVPFRMKGVRPRFIPALPWISAFPEFNVRTYVNVRDRGIEKAGVYFFSLEAANPIAVALARSIFQLPYFHAKMALQQEGDRIHYASRRTHRGAQPAQFIGSYGPTSPIYHSTPGSFDAWLTERYALYTTGVPAIYPHQTVERSQAKTHMSPERPIYIGEIHHDRWPLQEASATFQVNQITNTHGISLPAVPPILHFARHIQMVVWPLRKVEQ